MPMPGLQLKHKLFPGSYQDARSTLHSVRGHWGFKVKVCIDYTTHYRAHSATAWGTALYEGQDRSPMDGTMKIPEIMNMRSGIKKRKEAVQKTKFRSPGIVCKF